jgi:biotin transport system permease protein
MSLSPYFLAGDSRLHQLDPRSKLIAAMAMSILTLRATIPALGPATILLFAIPALSRISLRHVYQTVRPALAFILVLFCLQALFSSVPSGVLFSIGPVRITTGGCIEGLITVWRLILLLLVGALLTATTRVGDLANGMEVLLRPVGIIGVSSQDIALMLSLALRFIPTLSLEMEVLKDARAVRGEALNAGNILQRGRVLSNLVVPFLLGVFRRCDELIIAMEARGYEGGRRTGLTKLHLGFPDCVIIAAATVIVVVSFFQ